MKLYVASLLAGLFVGVIYALIGVRSPAPPVIALIGLFGMLAGEQVPPLLRSMLRDVPAAQSWLHQVRPHMFGHMPSGGLAKPVARAAEYTAAVHSSNVEKD